MMAKQKKKPDERLTSKQVSEEFNIPNGTLGYWRHQKDVNPKLPRYHRLHGRIFYIRHEIEQDLEGEAM